jgi:hypothetical protein
MISPGVGCLCWPTQVRSFGVSRPNRGGYLIGRRGWGENEWNQWANPRRHQGSLPRKAQTAGRFGGSRRHRRHGGAYYAARTEGMGSRSLRRLHHALDRGVAIGAGELRLIPRSPSARRGDLHPHDDLFAPGDRGDGRQHHGEPVEHQVAELIVRKPVRQQHRLRTPVGMTRQNAERAPLFVGQGTAPPMSQPSQSPAMVSPSGHHGTIGPPGKTQCLP